MADVAAHWGLCLSDIQPERTKTMSDIRAVAAWVLHEQKRFSLNELASMFGAGDHTTIMSRVKKASKAVARFDKGEDDWLGRVARSVLAQSKGL